MNFRLFPLVFLFSLNLVSCGGDSESSSGGSGASTDEQWSATLFSQRLLIPNSLCPNGGIEVDSGVDSNMNGMLDADEVTDTDQICHGVNGLMALVDTEVIESGEQCQYGGILFHAGIDQNGDQVLELEEIATSTSACNFYQEGIDGLNSLVDLSDEPAGINCANGGQRIDTGSDTDRDNVLDVDEILSSKYLCNGIDAKPYNALLAFTDEPAGSNCSNGGVLVKAGLDTNRNGVLDNSEATSQSYVCNGTDGYSPLPENNPPVVSLPASVEVSYISTTDVTVSVSDPEGNPVSISWVILQSPTDGDLQLMVKNNFRTVTASATVPGTYTLQAQVTDGMSMSYAQTDVTITNFAPVHGGLYLMPALATTSSMVWANFNYLMDEEGADLSVVYHWSVNDVEVADNTGSMLPALLAKKGDEISVYAEVSDGVNTVVTDPVTMSIANALPTYGSLSLAPQQPDTTMEIQATLDSLNDIDGDTLTVSYQWSINDVVVPGQATAILPSGAAKKGDVVSALAQISDGSASVTTSAVTLNIGDAPTQLTVTGLPDQVNHGELLEFSVTAVDPDEAGVTLELAYGPSGMVIDVDGQVTWTPDEVMFLTEEVFQFGFKTSVSDSIVSRHAITVVDNGRQLPIARSGIEVPRVNYSLWVEDFDNDGKNEILSTDSKNLIFTLEFDGVNYVQDWLYPFNLETNGKIIQLLAEDISEDGLADVVVLTSNNVHYITSRSQSATMAFSLSEGSIVAAAIDNIDADASLEMAMIVNVSYQYQLRVYQMDDWSLEYSSALASTAQSLLIGNVDDDTALEIVTNNGYVIDGENYVQEWYFSTGFGTKLAVADVDNNGVDEIIGVSNNKPKIFNVPLESEIAEINTTNVCSLNAGNMDADPQDEILIGGCWSGSGNIRVFDSITGTPVQQSSIANPSSGALSIMSGDVDNDGQVELVWGTGTDTSGEDILVVGEVTPVSQVGWYNKNPSQLDTFTSAGWAAIAPGIDKAIFVVPRTDSSYKGQRIVQIDNVGNMSISSEVLSNWDNASYGFAIDYDDDGYAEIFLATAATYDGYFHVRQLSDNSLEWSAFGGTYDNTVSIIAAADVNKDSREDALVVDGRIVKVVDVYNQSFLWTSTSFASTIYDVAAMQSAMGDDRIVVAASGELSIWRKDVSTYVREYTVTANCRRINVVDAADLSGKEIICLQYDDYYYELESTFEVLDATLQQKRSFTIDGAALEFKVEEGAGQNNILVANYGLLGPYSHTGLKDSHLTLVSSANGEVIWESPILLDNVPHRSLHYLPAMTGQNKRVTFATIDAMYISR